MYKVDDGILPLGFLLALLIRWTVSLYPYSGKGKPPMFGDYEAQRHWQEITWNVPVDKWYTNSSRNDLMYWGLDYPPLTAYHSYLCAFIANKYNSSWIQLTSSRGTESPSHKLFMRSTVLIVDVLVYMSAVFMYWFRTNQQLKPKRCAFILTLLYPGLLLIDHGHFQYNCASLGLALWAIWALIKGHDVLGTALFTASLNYKQMELYHALPFFSYLLGSCLKMQPVQGLFKFLKLFTCVIAVFAIIWYPYIWNMKTLVDVLRRLFPFNRGLYEDKVANVWCCLSIFIKLKSLLAFETLAKISLIVTVLAVLPSSIDLLLKPSINRFKLTLINSALVFFLFSFQVHEKSILLAAMPVCCVLPYYPLASVWFLLISVYSMFPLLLKDHLLLPVFATTFLFFLLAKNVFLRSKMWQNSDDNQKRILILFAISMVGAILLSAAYVYVPTPKRYPDVHALLCSMYCCCHFLLFAGYFHWKQFTLPEDGKEMLHAKKHD